MIKKASVIIGLLVMALGAVSVYLIWNSGQSGSNALEQWIGSELQSIANSYLNPQLSFSDLDYQYPGTVKLKNLRLTADDPANAGKVIDIIAADEATLTLAEIPAVGKPIVIEKIVLNQPRFAAVALFTNSNQFVGFSKLMRNDAAEELKKSVDTPPTTAPRARLKFSDRFQLKLIELVDGKIVYDPRIPGTQAMQLDQINTRLNIVPDADGTYQLKVSVKRDPVFDLAVDGKLNLDHFTASGVSLKLDASLSAENLNYLPPQLQQILKQYEARGELAIRVTGDVPLLNPSRGSLHAEVGVTDANVSFAEYRIPIESLSLAADLADRRLSVPSLRIKALHGEAAISANFTLNDVLDSHLSLRISDMMLQDLMSRQMAGKPTALAGRLNAQADVTAPIKVIVAKATKMSGAPDVALAAQHLPANWGSASVDLEQGRLIVVPMIQKIGAGLRSAEKLIGRGESSEPSDTLHITCEFSDNRAVLSDIRFVGDVIAARGKGTVWLDQSLDLKLNAGPLEKMQSLLGGVGSAIARVTDAIVSYRVAGTLQNPAVSVEVGDGAVNTVTKTADKAADVGTKAADKAADAAGKAVDGIGKAADTIGSKLGKLFGGD